jgi:hypothetical protein
MEYWLEDEDIMYDDGDQSEGGRGSKWLGSADSVKHAEQIVGRLGSQAKDIAALKAEVERLEGRNNELLNQKHAAESAEQYAIRESENWMSHALHFEKHLNALRDMVAKNSNYTAEPPVIAVDADAHKRLKAQVEHNLDVIRRAKGEA